MCLPNFTHPQAVTEYTAIRTGSAKSGKRATTSQLVALAAAKIDALLACKSGSLSSLTLAKSNARGDIYFLERRAGLTTTAHASVALYAGERCMDIYALDVSGSGWWHAPPDPDLRALRLL